MKKRYLKPCSIQEQWLQEHVLMTSNPNVNYTDDPVDPEQPALNKERSDAIEEQDEWTNGFW